jgi:hypothetical protein
MLSLSQKKIKCCSLVAMLVCMQVCAPEAITHFLWTGLLHSSYSPDLAPCEDTIMLVMRHCRMTCASGCREENQPLYHVGKNSVVQKWKKLSTEMETTLEKQLCLQQSVVKLCDIFAHWTCELHETQNRKHYFPTAPFMYMCTYIWIFNIWLSYVEHPFYCVPEHSSFTTEQLVSSTKFHAADMVRDIMKWTHTINSNVVLV